MPTLTDAEIAEGSADLGKRVVLANLEVALLPRQAGGE